MHTAVAAATAAVSLPVTLALVTLGSDSDGKSQVRLGGTPTATSTSATIRGATLDDRQYVLIDAQSGERFNAHFYQSSAGQKITVTVQTVAPGFASQDQMARSATPVQVNGRPGYTTTLGDSGTYLAWSESPTTLVTLVGTSADLNQALNLAREVTVTG